jgi:hypothetical protein
MRRFPLLVVLAASLALAGCGSPDASLADDDTQPPPGAGMCAPDMPDCVDTVSEPDGEAGDADPTDPSQADSLLGVAEADLDEFVRIARRGDEAFMLTEDYVVGRLTVELDADDEGVYRVTKATLERPDGPYTAEVDA